MKSRRVVWVVERNGAAHAVCFTKSSADHERSEWERFCLDGSKFTVTRYVPAKPKRRSPVDR